MDARSISDMVADEHPQIIALIISYLDYAMGADVLNQLPEDIQADVIKRIASLEMVQPEALRELERVMQNKFKDNTNLRASQVGGVSAAAKIMNAAIHGAAHYESAGQGRQKSHGRHSGEHVCFRQFADVG